MNKTALITGTTAGFGEACAHVFAQNGYRVILNARRVDRLVKLQQLLQKEYKVETLLLPFDVRDNKAVQQAISTLPEEWQAIDVLVNNAGLALGRDFFDEAKLEDWDTMIDTNVKGLLYVSKAVIPFMIARKKGQVINIGSIAGKESYEKGNTYCATKAAVDSLSRSMRIDLLKHRIKVTAIHPGAAETEFSIVRFKGSEAEAAKVYENFQPLSARDVADAVYYTASLPAHVCINDLVIMPTQQANATLIDRSGNL